MTVGQGGMIFVSSNGINWARSDSGTTVDLNRVTFGAGRFIAAGNIVIGSADGNSWLLEPVHCSTTIYSAGFMNGTFWLAGGSGGSSPAILLQSDPLAAPSAPFLTGRLLPSGYELSISGLGSGIYRVQSCISPSLNAWSNALVLTNPPSVTTWVDPNVSGEAQKFYRVIRE